MCMCALVFLLQPGVTEVQEPNCYETEWSLSCNRMSVFDLSLWLYLCMSVCLRSINLQIRIIFICSNSLLLTAPPPLQNKE